MYDENYYNWIYEEEKVEETDLVNFEIGFSITDPFDQWVKGLRALVGADPDVTVLSDEHAKVINVCVAGCSKPDAYRLFFPGTLTLKGVGDIKILVNGHKKDYKTTATFECLQHMFANHPLVKEVKATYTPAKTINRIFVVFKNLPIQYKSDDLSSPWSVTTTTPEELAKKVMKGSGMVVLWVTDSDFELEKNSPDLRH